MTGKAMAGWLALFAFLTLFASGKWAVAPAAWIVPVLGLYIIHRSSARRGALLLLVAGFIPSLLGWYGVVPFPMPIYPLFMLFNALVATFPYLADRLIVPRLGSGFATTLLFPLVATATEFIMMGEGPLGSFGAQAYTQAAFAPLTQLASITGLWGITFLVSWFASVAHWAWSRRDTGQPIQPGFAFYGTTLAAVLIFGAGRLLTAPTPEATVSISALTAAHVDMGRMMSLLATDSEAFRQETRDQHAAYLAQTAETGRSGTQIVLWPELAGLGAEQDVERLVSSGQELAREHDLYLIMPLFIVDPAGSDRPINKVVVADPQGDIVLEHVKFGGNILEGTTPGSRDLQTVETPFGTLSVVICWDTDYPAVIRQAGQQDVDILLSPAYVWPEVARIHAEMATFRSIENGLTVVRHSDNGISQVSDAYGRVIASENHIGQESVAMTVDAPLMRAATYYPALGDVIGQMSVAGLLFITLAVIARRFVPGAFRVGQPV